MLRLVMSQVVVNLTEGIRDKASLRRNDADRNTGGSVLEA
jgi:hypothetical protein